LGPLIDIRKNLLTRERLLQKQFPVRAYQTTFTTGLTVFFFFQSSEANVQRDGVGANAMPGETDSLAQGADRQEQVSSLYSLLIQPEKTILRELFRLFTKRRQFVNI